jgi:hypothetical protein
VDICQEVNLFAATFHRCGRAALSLHRGWTRRTEINNIKPRLGLTHQVERKINSGRLRNMKKTNFSVFAGILTIISLFYFAIWLDRRGHKPVIQREWKESMSFSQMETNMPFYAKVLSKNRGQTGSIEYSNASDFVYIVVKRSDGETIGLIKRNPSVKDLTNVGSLIIGKNYRFPDAFK